MLEPESAWIQDSELGKLDSLALDVFNKLKLCTSVYLMIYSQAHPSAIAGWYDPEASFSPENLEIHISEMNLALDNGIMLVNKPQVVNTKKDYISENCYTQYTINVKKIKDIISTLSGALEDIHADHLSYRPMRLYKSLFDNDRWLLFCTKVFEYTASVNEKTL